MIQDKEKVEKLYKYFSALATAHASSSSKYNGWSQYNKNNKKKCYSSELWYKHDDSCKNMTVELYDIDFNYKDSFWSGSEKYKRIYIRIRIAKDFSELEIKECTVKDGANLVEFFKRLDNVLDNYEDIENSLTKILLSKVED